MAKQVKPEASVESTGAPKPKKKSYYKKKKKPAADAPGLVMNGNVDAFEVPTEKIVKKVAPRKKKIDSQDTELRQFANKSGISVEDLQDQIALRNERDENRVTIVQSFDSQPDDSTSPVMDTLPVVKNFVPVSMVELDVYPVEKPSLLKRFFSFFNLKS